MHADATDEDVAARRPASTRARALATVLPDDAANVFITLSARSLNPRADHHRPRRVAPTENKLMQAGANRVVLPAHIGAERVAELLLHRDMTQMIDKARGGSPRVPRSICKALGWTSK